MRLGTFMIFLVIICSWLADGQTFRPKTRRQNKEEWYFALNETFTNSDSDFSGRLDLEEIRAMVPYVCASSSLISVKDITMELLIHKFGSEGQLNLKEYHNLCDYLHRIGESFWHDSVHEEDTQMMELPTDKQIFDCLKRLGLDTTSIPKRPLINDYLKKVSLHKNIRVDESFVINFDEFMTIVLVSEKLPENPSEGLVKTMVTLMSPKFCTSRSVDPLKNVPIYEVLWGCVAVAMIAVYFYYLERADVPSDSDIIIQEDEESDEDLQSLKSYLEQREPRKDDDLEVIEEEGVQENAG